MYKLLELCTSLLALVCIIKTQKDRVGREVTKLKICMRKYASDLG